MRDGYTTLFLTLTLSNEFHQFSKTTKRYNPKYNEENTIEKWIQIIKFKL